MGTAQPQFVGFRAFAVTGLAESDGMVHPLWAAEIRRWGVETPAESGSPNRCRSLAYGGLRGTSSAACARQALFQSRINPAAPPLDGERSRMSEGGEQLEAGRRGAAGAIDPIDELYRRYADWLGRALALRLRFSRPDVEDIVQETYVRVSGYSSADLARYPKALLLRVGVNLARDRIRRSTRHAAAITGPEAGSWFAATSSPPDQEQSLLLKEVVLSLPDPLRDVFVLSRFTTMTYDQIASHLGISVKTVEWRMTKALSHCAQHLRD